MRGVWKFGEGGGEGTHLVMKCWEVIKIESRLYILKFFSLFVDADLFFNGFQKLINLMATFRVGQ